MSTVVMRIVAMLETCQKFFCGDGCGLDFQHLEKPTVVFVDDSKLSKEDHSRQLVGFHMSSHADGYRVDYDESSQYFPGEVQFFHILRMDGTHIKNLDFARAVVQLSLVEVPQRTSPQEALWDHPVRTLKTHKPHAKFRVAAGSCATGAMHMALHYPSMMFTYGAYIPYVHNGFVVLYPHVVTIQYIRRSDTWKIYDVCEHGKTSFANTHCLVTFPDFESSPEKAVDDFRRYLTRHIPQKGKGGFPT